MRNLLLLLKLNFDEEFRISVSRYEKNPVQKRALFLQRIIALCCAIGVWILFYNIGKTMVAHDMGNAIPVFSYTIGSILCLVLTILKIIEVLSGKEDSEYQMSLPLPTFFYVLCIFLRLYLWNTFAVLLTNLPMLIPYIQSGQCSYGFIPYWIIGVLVTCLPIIGVASLLGMFFALIIAPKKNSNQIHSVMTLLFLTGILIVILNLITGISTIASSLSSFSDGGAATEFIRMVCKNYKLGRFYQHGIAEQNGLWMFLFILVSMIWNLFFVFFLTITYQVVILALREPHKYGTYTFTAQQQTDLKRALFQKELNQYIRSRSYLSSTMLGMIFALLCSIYTLAFKPQVQTEWKYAIPFLLCALIGTSNTTYCSYSMDGRRHWLTQTLPVDEHILRWAKLKLNVCITIPCSILCSILLILAFHPGILLGVIYIILPIGYAFFNAWWGLMIGKKYAEYSLSSENQILRQSTAFFAGWLPGALLPLFFGIIIILI